MSKNSINDIVPFPPAENMVHILERKGFTCAGTWNLNYDSMLHAPCSTPGDSSLTQVDIHSST